MEIGTGLPDVETAYRAVQGRDPRFDGRLFLGVTSTGIYCRPSCPARTPKPENVRFYATAAAAVAAGFRACKRCRPDALPGSRDWDHRGDLVGRALRLIAAGAVDDAGVAALARRLHVSERHLHRSLVAELGVGALALARTRRAQTARLLVDETDLPLTEVAFAAGFASIRQFNDVMREEFGCPPSALRRALRAPHETDGRTPGRGAPLVLRLVHREPYAAGAWLRWHEAHAVPGLEEVVDGTYRRTLTTTKGPAVVELTPGAGHLLARLHLEDLGDLTATVAALRRSADLDADPTAVDGVLAADPHLAPLVARRPGVRVPGTVDGLEVAVRTVISQQVSLAGARRLTTRLVEAYGDPLAPAALVGTLTTCFPTAEALLRADLTSLGLTGTRQRTIQALARQVEAGDLDLTPGADREDTRRRLLSLPGVGPWTADVIAMRALADPDAWVAGDLILRRAVSRRGADPEAWRPWRAYAALHLWTNDALEPTLEVR
ncbi:MAG TPA: Ada metal-binding domain-containing protein [Actinomycetes bacterium]|nr:Ada metal-binding domain-containing protein [Actinomycetes bacterium]